MLDLAPELLPVLRAGEAVAVVTITGVPRSAPRGVGASMAVTATGRVIGSISGGCVEGDAVMLASAVLADGVARSARFGFTDDAAHAAGLACGGSIDVVVYRVDSSDIVAMDALGSVGADRRTRVAVVCEGADIGRVVAATALPTTDDGILDNYMQLSAYNQPATLVLGHAPKPRLIIAGAGDHAASLCRIAASAGFAVTICDAWALLVTPERFPDADRLVVGLPHDYLVEIGAEVDQRTAICVLTHDERLDVPALRVALRMPIGFVGAMGSRSTVARRAALLRQAGVPDADIDRLHSPLGLDLQGSSPDETAIAILAEIVAARHLGTGLPLRDLHGALHQDGDPASCSVTTPSEVVR
jgi:xanthine dehydrogenase accessory factor